MANIQERRDKNGKLISYSVRVHRGRGPDGKQLKPWTATFEVLPTWTEKSARKKAEAFAATFEKECREGTRSDSRQKLGEYVHYVIDLKESTGVKHTTITLYRALAERIVPALGHVKLKDLYLNDLIERSEYERDYTALRETLRESTKAHELQPPPVDITPIKEALTLYHTLTRESKKEFWSRTISKIVITNEGDFSVYPISP